MSWRMPLSERAVMPSGRWGGLGGSGVSLTPQMVES